MNASYFTLSVTDVKHNFVILALFTGIMILEIGLMVLVVKRIARSAMNDPRNKGKDLVINFWATGPISFLKRLCETKTGRSVTYFISGLLAGATLIKGAEAVRFHVHAQPLVQALPLWYNLAVISLDLVSTVVSFILVFYVLKLVLIPVWNKTVQEKKHE